jgi:hypothetical protein
MAKKESTTETLPASVGMRALLPNTEWARQNAGLIAAILEGGGGLDETSAAAIAADILATNDLDAIFAGRDTYNTEQFCDVPFRIHAAKWLRSTIPGRGPRVFAVLNVENLALNERQVMTTGARNVIAQVAKSLHLVDNDFSKLPILTVKTDTTSSGFTVAWLEKVKDDDVAKLVAVAAARGGNAPGREREQPKRGREVNHAEDDEQPF